MRTFPLSPLRVILWLMVLLLPIAPSVRAVEDLTSPIAIKADAYTSKTCYRQLTAWKARIYADAFHAHGRTGKPWDADAEAFMRQVLTYSSEGEEEGEASSVSEDRKARHGELAESGRNLLEAGCDDPTVIYLATLFDYHENKDWRRAFAGYEKAIQRFEATSIYPRAVAINAGLALRVIYLQNGYSGDRARALDAKLQNWLFQSVTDGSFTKEEDCLFVQHLVSGGWRSLFARNVEAMAKWLLDSPVPEWARHTLIGVIEADRA